MAISRKDLPVYEFTKEGFEKLKSEEKKLISDRVGAVANLAEARSMGDLSENGYYKEAKATLSSIDSRLRQIALRLKYGKVIEKSKGEVISFGSIVKIEIGGKDREFEIVGKEESDPLKGRLSTISPIGKALIGKKKGDIVKVKLATGEMEYKILEVK